MTVAAPPRLKRDLRRLAGLYNVQTAYLDVGKIRRQATPEALIAVLRALGAPLDDEGDITSAVADRQAALQQRLLEPVIVAWDGEMPPLETPRDTRATITLETGQTHKNGRSGVRLPNGYHTLEVRRGRRRAESLVISAPKRSYTGEPRATHDWGLFIPLYALQSAHSWGGGDLSDLGRLVERTADLSGGTVSTLPLLAAYLDEPFQPSPYSPASRLFWNEFYLDVTAAPEFAISDTARSKVASADFQRELADLRAEPEVSYRRVMALKREILAELSDKCFADPARQDELRRFIGERPEAEDYARFRAAVERRRGSWQSWPEAMRAGRIRPGDYSDQDFRYHLYVQFLAHEQLSSLRDSSRQRNARLYFDLPLGVDSAGYDNWRHRASFLDGVSAGAPPDAFFTLGQDWGFAPPHPERARQDGYRYFRAVLGNILRYAGALRIDHILGLHRLYCIPVGMDARDGVYIRYPAEELYAILSLESHRHKALIAGEDLGTVPSYVHDAMSRHAINRSYVLQYELNAETGNPLPEPRRAAVASLNTHDMPPFAAYWAGLDIDDRFDLGLIDADQADQERADRAETRRRVVAELRRRRLLTGDADPAAVLRALLLFLAGSRARLVLVNLEDLWLEERSQNVPGTTDERVNWRRKASCTLEEIEVNDSIASLLKELDGMRRKVRNARRN